MNRISIEIHHNNPGACDNARDYSWVKRQSLALLYCKPNDKSQSFV